MKCPDAATEDRCDPTTCQWVSGKCRPLATAEKKSPTFFEWMACQGCDQESDGTGKKRWNFGAVLLRFMAWVGIVAVVYFVLRLAYFQGARRLFVYVRSRR